MAYRGNNNHKKTINELPQALPSFDPTCYSGDGSSFTYDSTLNVFDPPSQPPTYSCEFCGNDAHYGYDSEEWAANIDQSPPQEISIQYMEDLKQHYLDEMKSLINDLQIKDYHNERIDIQYRRECEIRIDELKQNFNGMSIKIKKKEKELLKQDDVISELPPCVAIRLDEVIKSSVEDLVPIPSESEGILDNMCDVPFHDYSPPLDISKDQFEVFSDSNDDSTSIDDDSFSIDDIDYVEASPLDSGVSLEVVEIVIPEVGGIDTDILLTIKDDILREKLLNVNLLIAKIEALIDNPTPSPDFVTKSSSTSLDFFLEETNTFDNSLPESKTFCFNLEEISSGSPTSYIDLSLPNYEAFFCDSEPDSGDFTMDVMEDIFDNPTREPRVHVPNDCPDFEASRARGFVLRSLELQIISFIMGIQYPNLID
ncbi:hypothetical protein Tco_1013784 [Tanacetum coccineum]